MTRRRPALGGDSAYASPVFWLYGTTIFLGAYLLFAVQPLMGKYILPSFGGGTSVWTSCLLFFQVLLVGGYGYTHLLVGRLPPRPQLIVYAVSLAAAVVTLPIAPPDAFRPTPGRDPTLDIVLLLLRTVGLPYVALSAASPLLQAWCCRRVPVHSVYRLYALSNAGALFALISYPVLIEPNIARSTQASLWSSAFALFALLCLIIAVSVWGDKRTPAPEPSANRLPDNKAGRHVQAMWIALPAAATALLLATTNKLCQEIAVAPFLWVLPLALYVSTFILAFDRPHWYRRSVYLPILFVGLLASMGALAFQPNLPLLVLALIHGGTLTAGCMVCHAEAYRLRPGAERLTAFYLALSLGGALGGAAVALLAPSVLHTYLELPLSLLACGIIAILCPAFDPDAARGKRLPLRLPRMFAMAALGIGFWSANRAMSHNLEKRMGRIIGNWRNFYGVVTIHDDTSRGYPWRIIQMNHGGVCHGLQFSEHPTWKRMPTTYYGAGSGIGLLLDSRRKEPPRRMGVVGLGNGTLAAYGRPGDTIVFYEINPLVVQLASRYFTYLSDTPASLEAVLGDARLSLAAEPPRGYDILVLDAFNGDTPPMHLLTREAFSTFARHLSADGILAFNVTNRRLRLRAVVEQLAQNAGFASVFIRNDGRIIGSEISLWVLVARDPRNLDEPALREQASPPQDLSDTPLWSDENSSLFDVLR